MILPMTKGMKMSAEKYCINDGAATFVMLNNNKQDSFVTLILQNGPGRNRNAALGIY